MIAYSFFPYLLQHISDTVYLNENILPPFVAIVLLPQIPLFNVKRIKQHPRCV